MARFVDSSHLNERVIDVNLIRQKLRRANSLVSFLVEVSLMLEADQFLAWGVSEVDDVVERERMRRNLSWCSAYPPPERDGPLQYPSWCWWKKELQLRPLAGVPLDQLPPAMAREIRQKYQRPRQRKRANSSLLIRITP